MATQGGFSALVWAAIGGHRETAELLLDRGADVEADTVVSSATRMLRIVPHRGDTGRPRAAMGCRRRHGMLVAWLLETGSAWDGCQGGNLCVSDAAMWCRRMVERH